MKKALRVTMVTIASLALTISVAQAFSEYNITSNLGGESGDFFDIDGTLIVDSIKVGQEGIGGVTFFNGTIVNNTQKAGGADNPVTFGDNVRIDGRVFRGETAGTGDTMPFIVNDNMEVTGTLDVTGDLTVTGLTGTGVVGTNNLADVSVTNAKLADSSVTPSKIEGTGGANLPIAYGFCQDDGTTMTATTNATCSWDTSRYVITIDGEEFYYNQYVTIVTPISDGMIPATSSINDELLVSFTKHDGTPDRQTDFAFVVYKP